MVFENLFINNPKRLAHKQKKGEGGGGVREMQQCIVDQVKSNIE